MNRAAIGVIDINWLERFRRHYTMNGGWVNLTFYNLSPNTPPTIDLHNIQYRLYGEYFQTA